MDKHWKSDGNDSGWGVLANWWDDLEEFGEGHSDVQSTSLPVAGDAFDVLFRANVRNVRMLRRWMDKQPR